MKENKRITKVFTHQDWLVCLSKIRRFVDDYNLVLVAINLERLKNEDNQYFYEAEIEYELGVR